MNFINDNVLSDLRQVGGFPVSSTNKTDLHVHDITEIKFKVALNTIPLASPHY